MKKQPELNFVHGEKYSVALQITKNFVRKPTVFGPAVLQYVHHAKGGMIEATDSHRGIRIHNIHGFKEDYLIDPKTFTVATGEYAKLSKLFDETKENHTHVMTIEKRHLRVWHQLLKSINQTVKTLSKDIVNDKTIHLKFEHNRVKVLISDLGVAIQLPAWVHRTDVETYSVHAGYLRDMIDAFMKMESDAIYLHVRNNNLPMYFTDGNNVEQLLLPVRMGREIPSEEEMFAGGE